jgi:hypothetical protein
VKRGVGNVEKGQDSLANEKELKLLGSVIE